MDNNMNDATSTFHDIHPLHSWKGGRMDGLYWLLPLRGRI